MQITLNIPENKLRFFMEMISNLSFVEVVRQSAEANPEMGGANDSFRLSEGQVSRLEVARNAPKGDSVPVTQFKAVIKEKYGF